MVDEGSVYSEGGEDRVADEGSVYSEGGMAEPWWVSDLR